MFRNINDSLPPAADESAWRDPRVRRAALIWICVLGSLAVALSIAIYLASGVMQEARATRFVVPTVQQIARTNPEIVEVTSTDFVGLLTDTRDGSAVFELRGVSIDALTTKLREFQWQELEPGVLGRRRLDGGSIRLENLYVRSTPEGVRIARYETLTPSDQPVSKIMQGRLSREIRERFNQPIAQ